MKLVTKLAAGPPDRFASRAVLLLGMVIGGGSFAYYYAKGMTVAHYDAKAHLFVARRIVDSVTPGYAQLGSHWLPVTHLVYLPFVAFEPQYRSGFIPSLLSVLAFALSGWLTYRIAQRMTGLSGAGIFAAIILLANGNLQYLQSCPLTEPLYMLLALLAMDGLLAWRDGEGGELPWWPAVWSTLACLCRYEGWYMLGGVLLLIAWDYRQRVLTAVRAVRAALLYFLTFAIPIAAHFGYLYLQVEDSFLIRVVQGNPSPLETYKRPFLSLAYHVGELAQIAALAPLAAAVAGLIYCFSRRERLRRYLPLFLLWFPSAINISALYWGMIYRVRYSALLLPAIAVFASLPASDEKAARRVLLAVGILVILLPWIPSMSPREWRYHVLFAGPGIAILPVAAMLLILAGLAAGRHMQALLLLCVLEMQVPALAGEHLPILDETLEHSFLEPERQQVLQYWRQHYDGSPILVDSQKLAPLLYDSGLPLKKFIYNEGHKALWLKAVEEPEKEVGWICALKGDEIWERLHVDPRWADRYALVSHNENLLLYRLKPMNR